MLYEVITGFAVADPATAEMIGKLTNTSLSCVPPFVQLAVKHHRLRQRVDHDPASYNFV